jgi:hypothetical protein
MGYSFENGIDPAHLMLRFASLSEKEIEGARGPLGCRLIGNVASLGKTPNRRKRSVTRKLLRDLPIGKLESHLKISAVVDLIAC